MQYNKSEFLIETTVPDGELIISRTDLKGNITHANETFAHISGYSVDELIGQPHNIVRHPDMPKRVFQEMWDLVKKGKKWNGKVKNLRKDGGFYWVDATISGVYKDGELVEFKSIRTPINYEQKLKAQKMYDEIREIDKDNIRTISYE